MKILAVGRNYVDHIQELNNEIPDEPVIFTKPDTSIILKNKPFYYPEFSTDIHYEVELVIKLSKHGRYIPMNFASGYFKEIALGIDFTARDLQSKAKSKGLPWTIAKGFDGSAPLSSFTPVADLPDLRNMNFSLLKNGQKVQEGNTKLMIYSFSYIISYISKYITLKKGDLIFTGTPRGVGPVVVGDLLEGFIGEKKLLKVEIK